MPGKFYRNKMFANTARAGNIEFVLKKNRFFAQIVNNFKG